MKLLDYQPIFSYGKSIEDITELSPFDAVEQIKKYSKVIANSEELKVIENALKEWLIDKEYIVKLRKEKNEMRHKDINNDINKWIEEQVKICLNCVFVNMCINTPIKPKPFICRKEGENGN